MLTVEKIKKKNLKNTVTSHETKRRRRARDTIITVSSSERVNDVWAVDGIHGPRNTYDKPACREIINRESPWSESDGIKVPDDRVSGRRALTYRTRRIGGGGYKTRVVGDGEKSKTPVRPSRLMCSWYGFPTVYVKHCP